MFFSNSWPLANVQTPAPGAALSRRTKPLYGGGGRPMGVLEGDGEVVFPGELYFTSLRGHLTRSNDHQMTINQVATPPMGALLTWSSGHLVGWLVKWPSNGHPTPHPSPAGALGRAFVGASFLEFRCFGFYGGVFPFFLIA